MTNQVALGRTWYEDLTDSNMAHGLRQQAAIVRGLQLIGDAGLMEEAECIEANPEEDCALGQSADRYRFTESGDAICQLWERRDAGHEMGINLVGENMVYLTCVDRRMPDIKGGTPL